MRSNIIHGFLVSRARPSIIEGIFVASRYNREILKQRLPHHSRLSHRVKTFFSRMGINRSTILLICPITTRLSSALRIQHFSHIVISLISSRHRFAISSTIHSHGRSTCIRTLDTTSTIVAGGRAVQREFRNVSSYPVRIIRGKIRRFSGARTIQLANVGNGGGMLKCMKGLQSHVSINLVLTITGRIPSIRILLIKPANKGESIRELQFRPGVDVTNTIACRRSQEVSTNFSIKVVPRALSDLDSSVGPLGFCLCGRLRLPVISAPVQGLNSFGNGICLSSKSIRNFASYVGVTLQGSGEPHDC